MVTLQLGNANSALAGDGNFIFSSVSNNTWAIEKSTRKLILIHFEGPRETWKSKPISIPDSFDLDHSRLKAVGARGTSASLYDVKAGLVTIFDANDDGSITTFEIVNVHESLK
jgi:hypothetical protein